MSGTAMTASKPSAQHRAIARHRRRFADSGLVRFEVRGLDRDKQLVRRLAERLLHDDPEARALRSELANKLGTSVGERGGIYAALRRSPLVGANLDLTRETATDRDVSL
jgi:hypothetical protein